MGDKVIEHEYYGPPKSLFVMIGAISISIVGAIGFANYSSEQRKIAEIELEKVRVERGHVLQERDLNGNGIPEKFYTIDGKIAMIELDGKPLFSSLDTKILEKEK